MILPDDVHIGKNGWLFLKGGRNNPIEYYKDPNLFNDKLIKSWQSLLNKRIEFFGRRKIQYVHLFVPNKLTIYPEYYAGELEYYDCSPIQIFYKSLKELKEDRIFDHIVNPIDYFNRQKRDLQLYWKTDTHWTFHGVYSAYQLICSKLGVEPIKDLFNRNTIKCKLAMDLGSKLNPAVTEDVFFVNLLKDSRIIFANEIVRFKEEKGLENDASLHVGSNVIFKNESIPNLKRVVLFGDSFSEYRTHLLTGMIAETFHEVHFVWSTSLDKNYIESVNPDIVITEIAERFMPKVPLDNFDLEKYSREKLDGIR
jgi:alginate O-acetyltransferase complex protein AlgJ